MKIYIHFILIFFLLTISNTGHAQGLENKRNEIIFDSLVSILKSDSQLIENIISELPKENDSIAILITDALTLPYNEILKKHHINSTDEENFISSINITTQLIETMNTLNSVLNITELDHLTNQVNNILIVDRNMKIDSIKLVIWSSQKVLKLSQNIDKLSNGQRKLTMYHTESEQYIEIKLVEDNNLTFVTHLNFRISPTHSWKIEHYDTINDVYTDFDVWNTK
jgi:hypothetical protein